MQTLQPGGLGLVFLQGDFRHADDAVHGCANLVGHPGKELGFGLRGLVMVGQVDAVLDDGAEFPEKIGVLFFLQKRGVHADEEQSAGIPAVIRHGEHKALWLIDVIGQREHEIKLL